MSKKRKRYRASDTKQTSVRRNEPGKAPLYIGDGYSNPFAFLGEASKITTASTYERHGISGDWEQLTVLYRENWIAKRIIDTPCEDMTRSWYTPVSQLDQNKLDELAKLERKHSIQQELTNAMRWARLYGGAAALIVVEGQEDMLDEPLDMDMLMPGAFKGLLVVDRLYGLEPSSELEEDMSDPEFGYPKWYTVNLDAMGDSFVRVHHSRLITFRGRMLPIQEEINESYWGTSELEHVYEELQKRNSTSANIAQLVFQANITALKMSDFGEALAMGTDKQRANIMRHIEEQNRLKTSFGMVLMNAEDQYEQHPYSFSGLSEIYESFMMDMAGAAEIPATKLYGRSPQGMNATGESDMKNYYEMLAGLQERHLRPALEKLMPIMSMSLWGVVPDDIEIEFNPLMTTTPSERAEISGKFTGNVIQAFNAGLISQKTALMELRESGREIGAWTKITDEDIDKASDEIDMGEEEEDPMGMMGGMMGMPPEMPQGGSQDAPDNEDGQEPTGEEEEPEEPSEDEIAPKEEKPSEPDEKAEPEKMEKMEKPEKPKKHLISRKA